MTSECIMKDYRLSLDNQIKLPTQMLYDAHRAGRGREREGEREREWEGENCQSQRLLDVTRLAMLQWITGKAAERNASFTPPVWVVRNRPQHKKWIQNPKKKMNSAFRQRICAHSTITQQLFANTSVLSFLCRCSVFTITALVAEHTLNDVCQRVDGWITAGLLCCQEHICHRMCFIMGKCVIGSQ